MANFVAHIFCCSYHAYSYNYYINKRMHYMTSIKLLHVLTPGAILREFIEQWNTSPTCSSSITSPLLK